MSLEPRKGLKFQRILQRLLEVRLLHQRCICRLLQLRHIEDSDCKLVREPSCFCCSEGEHEGPGLDDTAVYTEADTTNCPVCEVCGLKSIIFSSEYEEKRSTARLLLLVGKLKNILSSQE
eukprot:GHUV01042358.1.p1 GENE.GHUV01042358.1~~GHUV01042358.1.p1  ORF type:complete len:120 (-),score=9.40 GHUV01042358.1:1038-1397(-)